LRRVYRWIVQPRLAWQPSLLGSGPAEPDRAFRTLRRIELDDRSWVDYAPGWLSGADELFEELLRIGAWQQREVWMYERKVREPRLTAGWRSSIPGTRTFSREDVASALREVDAEPTDDLVPGGDSGTGLDALPPALQTIAEVLSERYGVGFDSVWVNLYRDGEDSVAWHGDRNAKVLTNPMVVTVSLGARRRFLLRARGTTRATHVLEPGGGDLVVMGGACQHEWEHTVPKTRRPVGPRMSVTIRHSC
jgi:alkylated DNA repair dioxygenase AlkB